MTQSAGRKNTMTETRQFPRRIFLPGWVWAIVFVLTIIGTSLTRPLWLIVGLVVL